MKSTSLFLLLALVAFATSEESSERQSKNVKSDEKNPAILPPLILLDFAEDENVEENSTSEEKSKRTIDGNLGYGYLKNNLFSGKYNYIFPGGQTGATVSIEESVSPFEPKTIIENQKPTVERPENHQGPNSHSVYQSKPQVSQPTAPIAQPWTASFPPKQQIFGQRTKLRKYTPSNTHGFTTTLKSNIAYTTIRPEFNNNNNNEFTTAKFSNQYVDYSTTPVYSNEYVAGLNPPGSAFETLTTPNPLSDDPTLFNIPRFTVEDGIRYENKIVWKYPDGRIANPPAAPATSYINSYSQFSGPHQTKINHQSTFQTSFNPSNNQNVAGNRPNVDSTRLHTGFKNPIYQDAPQNTRFSAFDAKQNLYSQKPAQFPQDQASYSSRPGANPQPSAFDLSYQSNYGFRQHENAKGSNRFDQNRPTLKYTINNANPEYNFPSNNPVTGTSGSNLFSQNGQVQQKYLSEVFTNSNTNNDKTPELSDNSQSFIEKNYESLLNYNPSISQYIKDPSSILHATPTFIQAGESLVPVIILRIDGARPVNPPTTTPNINLKALLQQYLTQYAGKTTGPNLYVNNLEDSSKFSPIEDLTYLTQALKRFSPKTNSNIINNKNFVNKKINKNINNNDSVNSNSNDDLNIENIANLPLEYGAPKYDSQKTSYDTIKNNDNNRQFTTPPNQRFKYPSTYLKPKQKVKSVQIIENEPPNYSTTPQA